MANTANKSETDLNRDVDTLKSDLAALRDDLKILAGDAVDEGKAKAQAVQDAAKDKFENTIDTLDTFVKDKPLTSVGIAFAAGILTSIYLHHR